MFAAEYQKQLKPAAKERQKKTQGRPAKGNSKTGGNVATSSGGTTRDQAAAQFSVSPRTVNKAGNVLEKGCKRLKPAAKERQKRKPKSVPATLPGQKGETRDSYYAAEAKERQRQSKGRGKKKPGKGPANLPDLK